MGKELRQRYALAAAVLIATMVLSLLLRLDFSNAALILKELRIPRLILAIAVGASLSLSGVVMQTLLGNPLADPYTLGIAAGAALGAAVGTTFGLKLNFFGLNTGAVFGAILVLVMLLRLVRLGVRKNDSIILMGVMLSLTSASLLAIWMAIADPMGVQSINFWLLGDLSRVGLAPALALLALMLVIAGYFFFFSRNLDAFLFGEEWVEGFGVSRARTLLISIVLISVLVGFCVSAAGMIGFVGLVIPHFVRQSIRTSLHRHLIPLSLLWGAIALTFGDSLARSISEPHELPVGAVTAVAGAPAFIYIFLRRKRGAIE